MGSHILVTGFPPYSLFTHKKNPSEVVARQLGELHGHAAQVEILPADANSVLTVRKLTAAKPRGILMFGANLQASLCCLELEGATTRWGDLFTDEILPSPFAKKMAPRCKELGLSVGHPPVGPLVHWCLKSYAEALRWAEPHNVPCAFVHLRPLSDIDKQFDVASKLFKIMAAEVG